MKKFIAAIAVFCCCTTANAQPTPAPQQWGTVQGRIVYDGSPPKPVMKRALSHSMPVSEPKEVPDESIVVGKNGGLENVFVYLRSKPSAIHQDYLKAEPKNVLLEFKNKRYAPHALGIWTHDILEYQNREKYATNPRSNSTNQGFNLLVLPEDKYEWRFKESEPVPELIFSSLQVWAEARLLVRDNPYFAITNERGNFCIPNLPAGEELEFVFWHERAGYLKNIKSDVAAYPTDENGLLKTKLSQPVTDIGEFRLDPKLFEVQPR